MLTHKKISSIISNQLVSEHQLKLRAQTALVGQSSWWTGSPKHHFRRAEKHHGRDRESADSLEESSRLKAAEKQETLGFSHRHVADRNNSVEGENRKLRLALVYCTEVQEGGQL